MLLLESAVVAVWASRLGAFCVKIEGVFLYGEATLLGDLCLTTLDFRVIKFFDATAVYTHQVIVMLSGIDFENGLARFKVVSFKESCLFKLGEDAVDGGQANVYVFGKQQSIYILGRQVANLTLLEQFKNFHARESGFEPQALKVAGITHRLGLPC